MGNLGGFHHPSVDQIEQAARGGDDNLGAGFDALDLVEDAGAAVDGHHPHFPNVR